MGMNSQIKKIGDRVKTLLKEKGVTQTALAQETGYSQSYISEMITGKKDILPLVEKLCELFNVSRDYIIAGNANTISDIAMEQGVKDTGNGLTQEDRLRLTEKLNSLYERQQDIINELQSIMKEVVSVNKLLITGEDVVGKTNHNDDAMDINKE